MKCAHCDKSNAPHSWALRLCAEGRRKRSKWLCDEHDAELNRLVLEFFNDPRVAEKMAAYRGGEG